MKQMTRARGLEYFDFLRFFFFFTVKFEILFLLYNIIRCPALFFPHMATVTYLHTRGCMALHVFPGLTLVEGFAAFSTGRMFSFRLVNLLSLVLQATAPSNEI